MDHPQACVYVNRMGQIISLILYKIECQRLIFVKARPQRRPPSVRICQLGSLGGLDDFEKVGGGLNKHYTICVVDKLLFLPPLVALFFLPHTRWPYFFIHSSCLEKRL